MENKGKEEKPPPKRNSGGQPFLYLSPFGYHFVFAFSLSAVITILNLVPAQIIRYTINIVLVAKAIPPLVWSVVVMSVVFLFRSLFMHLRTRLVSRMGQGISFNLRRRLFFHVQRLSLGFFDKTKTGQLLSRITNDTAYIQQFFTDGSHVFAVAFLTSLGVTAISFTMNWKLTLVAMLPIPLLAVMVSNYSKIARKIYRVIRRQWGTLTAKLTDDLGGIREIKSFNNERFEDARFGNENWRTYSLGVKVADLSSIYEPIIVFLSALGTVLVVGFGGWLTIKGEIKAGDLVAFLLYLNLMYQPIWQINSLVNTWEHARASSERIAELLSVSNEVYEMPEAVKPKEMLKGHVKFENVSFSYEKKGKLLENISFEAKPGEKIALVGPTGAGKTTIINLIPRFYDVDSGRITIDGVDIRRFDLNYLRQNIGIVLQEPFLFSGTIRENIAYGKPGASNKEIVEAAKVANAHEFIMDLSAGYQSHVGERGVKLSGGQKQRIAIARVLLKNPPILILDEATSSLDSETEKLVQEAFDRLMNNRTTFVVAHRLSTVKNADRILVIDKGMIVEEGTHEELLQNDGVYARLYAVQFEQALKLTV